MHYFSRHHMYNFARPGTSPPKSSLDWLDILCPALALEQLWRCHRWRAGFGAKSSQRPGWRRSSSGYDFQYEVIRRWLSTCQSPAVLMSLIAIAFAGDALLLYSASGTDLPLFRYHTRGQNPLLLVAVLTGRSAQYLREQNCDKDGLEEKILEIYWSTCAKSWCLRPIAWRRPLGGAYRSPPTFVASIVGPQISRNQDHGLLSMEEGGKDKPNKRSLLSGNNSNLGVLSFMCECWTTNEKMHIIFENLCATMWRYHCWVLNEAERTFASCNRGFCYRIQHGIVFPRQIFKFFFEHLLDRFQAGC